MRKIYVLAFCFALVFLAGLSLASPANERFVSYSDDVEENETEIECAIDSDCDDEYFCDDGECELSEDDTEDKEIENDTEEDYDGNCTECIDDYKRNYTKMKEKVRDEYDDNNGLGQTVRNRVDAGVYYGENRTQIRVRELAHNRTMLYFGENSTGFETDLELEENFTGNVSRFYARLKNGNLKQINVTADEAKDKILQRLKLHNCSEEENCTLELRELNLSKENSTLAYEIQTERHSRILGIFKSKMNVSVSVDAETGEIIEVKKPWWAFLATESEE